MANFSSKYLFFLCSGFLMLLLWTSTVNHAYAQIKATKLCLSECQDSTAATQFKDLSSTPAVAWRWNFGDPSSGAADSSRLKNPAHLYNTPGSKTVSLVRTLANGTKDSLGIIITINQPPTPFYLGNDPSQQDTTICRGERLRLDPYRSGGAQGQYQYSWFPKGETTQSIFADTTSCYSVMVTDTITGCFAENKINVKLCVPYPPKPTEELWYFGNGAGIKFSNGEPAADDQGKTESIEGVSGVTDSNGNTVFYTDGRKVYRKDGTLMPSLVNPADSLLGSSLATQGVIIVPVPSCKGCQSTYYVFTTTDINGKRQLTYSVVDMRKDAGKGAIVEKNIPLSDNAVTESVAATFVSTDSTYWVITHDYGNNTFTMYRVTKNGVSIPKTISIGDSVKNANQAQGYLKFSSDATKLAYAIPGPDRNLIEVYDFADSTGAISNKRVIDLGAAPPTLYGIEFSPDGNSIYASLTAGIVNNTPVDTSIKSQLVKFDITTADSATIRASKYVIDKSDSLNFGALKLGPDGKIYMAIQGKDSLAVIAQPDIQVATNSPVDTLGYLRNGFDLGGKISQLGLPNNVSGQTTQSDGVGFTVSTACFGTPTRFETSHLCGDKLKNTKTLWRIYKGALPASGQPSGNPILTLGGGSGDQDLQVSTTLSEAGTYHATVTMANRCKSDTTLPAQEFKVNPIPVANLGKDTTLCAASYTLDARNTLDSSTYLWSVDNNLLNATNRTLTARQSGTYKVVVERLGCTKEDEAKVTLLQPDVFDTADTTICQGSSVVLDASKNFTNTTTYQWSTGATTPTITVNTAGTYRVTVTTTINNIPCTVSDQIVVRLGSVPTFSQNVVNPTACISNSGAIAFTNFNPTGNYTFAWYKNGTLQSNLTANVASNLTAGQYQVLIKSDVSCPRTVNVTLTATGNPPAQITFNTSPVTCITDGAIGINVGNNSAFVPYTYKLQKQNAQGVYNLVSQGLMSGIIVTTNQYRLASLSVGTYQIVFENAAGCIFTSNALVLNSIPRTQVSINAPVRQCEGTLVTLRATNYSSGTIIWSTGETTPDIVAKTSGKYWVRVTSPDKACVNTDTSVVNYQPSPKVAITGPSAVCVGASRVQLTATPAGGTWAGGVSSSGLYTPPSFIKTDVIQYSVTQNGCTGTDTLKISVLAVPKIDMPDLVRLCSNEIRPIGVEAETGLTYLWNTGATTSKIIPNGAAIFNLKVSNAACSAQKSVTVNLLNPPFVSLKSPVALCLADANASVTLDARNGAEQRTYLWSPGGQTTPTISVNRQGIYNVLVTNSNGCRVLGTTQVVDLCEPDVIVPSIFTPNNDARNNTLQVFVKYVARQNFSLKIYNRWGEMVFATEDWDERWDGKYKGFLAPPNSYAWEITYKPLYAESETDIRVKKGSVTVAW